MNLFKTKESSSLTGYKIVLLGHGGVGKTAICERYLGKG